MFQFLFFIFAEPCFTCSISTPRLYFAQVDAANRQLVWYLLFYLPYRREWKWSYKRMHNNICIISDILIRPQCVKNIIKGHLTCKNYCVLSYRSNYVGALANDNSSWMTISYHAYQSSLEKQSFAYTVRLLTNHAKCCCWSTIWFKRKHSIWCLLLGTRIDLDVFSLGI